MESTAAVAESTAAVAVSTTHRRRWAAAEKELCAQGVERFGAFNHKRIAALVGTRTKAQVRSYLYEAGYRKQGAGYTTVAAAARETADLARAGVYAGESPAARASYAAAWSTWRTVGGKWSDRPENDAAVWRAYNAAASHCTPSASVARFNDGREEQGLAPKCLFCQYTGPSCKCAALPAPPAAAAPGSAPAPAAPAAPTPAPTGEADDLARAEATVYAGESLAALVGLDDASPRSRSRSRSRSHSRSRGPSMEELWG